MAYGFGATFGTNGSTDRIAFAVQPSGPTLNTWAIRTYQHGSGGGTFGRVFHHINGSGTQQIFLANDESSGNTLHLQIGFSGTDGVWSIPRPSFDTWHSHVVTYDGGSTANNPTWTVDGSAQTVTRVTAPTGTKDSAAASDLFLGNRQTSAQDRAWDGMLADFGWYNRIWSADEIGSYMAGFSTLFNVAGLLMQHDLIRASGSRLSGTTTVSGALAQPHPRVIFPPSRRTVAIHTTAGGGGGSNPYGIFPDQRGRLVLV